MESERTPSRITASANEQHGGATCFDRGGRQQRVENVGEAARVVHLTNRVDESLWRGRVTGWHGGVERGRRDGGERGGKHAVRRRGRDLWKRHIQRPAKPRR